MITIILVKQIYCPTSGFDSCMTPQLVWSTRPYIYTYSSARVESQCCGPLPITTSAASCRYPRPQWSQSTPGTIPYLTQVPYYNFEWSSLRTRKHYHASSVTRDKILSSSMSRPSAARKTAKGEFIETVSYSLHHILSGGCQNSVSVFSQILFFPSKSMI